MSSANSTPWNTLVGKFASANAANISVPSDYQHKIKYLVLLLLLAFYYGIVDPPRNEGKKLMVKKLKNQE